MGNYATQLAEQMGSQAAGGIMGLFLGGINDQRQIKQQRELQNMQLAGNKSMIDYQMMKQLEMWKNTSYEAQVEQMKKAGINPGLLYGMSGGGGQSTGNASGSVSGAQAPSGGGEAQAMGIATMAQMRLIEAQEENIRAQTENTKANTIKTETVDTGLARTQILDLTVGIDNKRAQAALTRVQERILTIEESIKGRTEEDVVRTIGWNAEKVMQELEQARYETNIQEETWNTKVLIANAELTGILVRNELTRAQKGLAGAQTTNVQKDTQLKSEQIQKVSQEITTMITELGQKWYQLSMEERKTLMTERLVKFNSAQSQRTYDNILRGVQTITTAIKPGTTINQTKGDTYINP